MSLRGGFTIVEVLMALLILVLLASVMVPSFSGVERRRVQGSIDRLQDLLSAYAYRDALGGQPLAVWRDPETGGVTLLVLHKDPDDPEAIAEWVLDRFTEPVILPAEVEIIEVLIGGRREPLHDWIVTRVPGQPRPSLEIDLVGPDDELITVMVSPNSLSAARIVAGRSSTAVRDAVDLDAIGADRELW